MTSRDIARELNVELPREYCLFYDDYPYRIFSGTCDTEFWNDTSSIIEMTKKYRSGFGVSPPWGNHYIFIGDDGAACPYALNTIDATVIHLDHGNFDKKPLGGPESLNSWLKNYKLDMVDLGVDLDAEPGSFYKSKPKDILIIILALGIACGYVYFSVG